MEKDFYIISDVSDNKDVFSKKYQCIMRATKKHNVTRYFNASGLRHGEYVIDFIFLADDGRKVMGETYDEFPSSNDFFCDTYTYDEVVGMCGKVMADNL